MLLWGKTQTMCLLPWGKHTSFIFIQCITSLVACLDHNMGFSSSVVQPPFCFQPRVRAFCQLWLSLPPHVHATYIPSSTSFSHTTYIISTSPIKLFLLSFGGPKSTSEGPPHYGRGRVTLWRPFSHHSIFELDSMGLMGGITSLTHIWPPNLWDRNMTLWTRDVGTLWKPCSHYCNLRTFNVVGYMRGAYSPSYKVNPPISNTHRKTNIMYHMHTFGST